ncbi:ferredoxin domain-containing protein [Bacteroides sp.]|uniref:ferredoxin domain-containing protein n=1 Tax=Bacteroides sp. TaxID=29523 RepID=UPI003AB56B49
MIQNERDCRHEHVLDVARQMMTAARTAPKGKGIDVIETALVTGEDLKKLSEKMVAMVEEHGMKFFLRDAENILQAECVVIIGTHELAQGLNCGHCGFATCAGRSEGVPCAINSVDVGIAIGSACAMAADLRVDTRVMFSAGLAAQRLDWLKGCTSVFAIPVSASSKNPFFDRKPKEEKK